MHSFTHPNKDHGESIYNMGGISERERRRQIYASQGQYVSRFACKVRREASCLKIGARKTMGCIRVCPNQPSNFLKKCSKTQPCFWKYEDPAVSCVPRPRPRSQICDCCNKPIYSDDNCLPRAKPSQSERCHNFRNNCKDAMNPNCRGSFSQPFLAGRTVSCQVEGQSGDCNEPNCIFECEGDNDDVDCGCGYCPRFGEEVDDDQDRCTCPRSGQGDCPSGRPYNGPVGYIDRGFKDFIRDNALSVMRKPPKIPADRIVVGHKGQTSEFVPKQTIGKKGFGCIPRYLTRVKQELCQKEFEMKVAMLKTIKPECRQLSFRERCLILEDLKLNWHDTLAEFNRLPISPLKLSPRQAKLKEELESTLNCIEKDIELITRNGPLLVGDVLKSNFIR